MYGIITLFDVAFQLLPLYIICSASSLSLAATREISIDFFSSGYLDVSVPRVRVFTTHLQCVRLPHSEICGSTIMCISPQLIAAYHVLHRL